MKINVVNMLRQAGRTLNEAGDGSRAYAVMELANNLRSLMRGEATIDEWNAVYVGQDGEPIDIDAELPETPS